MSNATDIRMWVRDLSCWALPLSWTVECSFPRCSNRAVMGMRRKRSPRDSIPARFTYCPDHMYGRRIHDGQVQFPVAPGSPAAERGYIDGPGA